MDMDLGTRISELRREKGMTQEQLAKLVGISAPAVSKWETGSSCPDIALLCPLARALDTNVDTLLQFEEELSQERLDEYLNEILEKARTGNREEAEAMLQKQLHTYPSSSALKYNATTVLNFFLMIFPMESPEKKKAWQRQKKQLFEEVRISGNPQYWQGAVSGLAAAAIQEEDFEEAELLLKELPENSTESTLLWMQLYLKKKEPEKALEVTQHRLYVLVRQMLMCLTTLMNGGMITDNEKVLEICGVYHRLEEIFGVGGGVSEGFFVEAYRRMDRPEDALKSLIKMVEASISPMQEPNPLLFSPTIHIEEGQSVTTLEMKQMLLNSILTDDFFAGFLEREELQEAIEKLKQDIRKESAGAKE